MRFTYAHGHSLVWKGGDGAASESEGGSVLTVWFVQEVNTQKAE